MKEIRIHGRGGQGNVLAAELLALAAFADGWHVQAFPAFGAERTGAPVQAFVRLSNQPIRRRSQIYEPDVVIVQDPTLLRTEDVLAGLRPNGLIIVNARNIPASLLVRTTATIYAIPATAIALEVIGRPIANTALLGAYAAITGDFSLAALSDAIRQRLGDRLAAENVEAARRGFEAARQTAPVRGQPVNGRSALAADGHVGTAQPGRVGVLAQAGDGADTSVDGYPIEVAGSSRAYLTGAWRTSRPVFLAERCNGCDLCVVYCPEGVVQAVAKNRYAVDYNYCKGCGICAEECPRDDIVMVEEVSER